MPRFRLGWLLSLASAAIGLFVADLVFSGFKLSLPFGFIWAVLLFAVFSAAFNWIVVRLLAEKANAALPLTGLLATFLALLVTTFITGALTIDGIGTWLMATLVIWILSIIVWVIPGPWRSARAATSPPAKG